MDICESVNTKDCGKSFNAKSTASYIGPLGHMFVLISCKIAMFSYK